MAWCVPLLSLFVFLSYVGLYPFWPKLCCRLSYVSQFPFLSGMWLTVQFIGEYVLSPLCDGVKHVCWLFFDWVLKPSCIACNYVANAVCPFINWLFQSALSPIVIIWEFLWAYLFTPIYDFCVQIIILSAESLTVLKDFTILLFTPIYTTIISPIVNLFGSVGQILYKNIIVPIMYITDRIIAFMTISVVNPILRAVFGTRSYTEVLSEPPGLNSDLILNGISHFAFLSHYQLFPLFINVSCAQDLE